MIVYRVAREEYSKKPYLLNGEGASKYPGRWNPRGIKTVYCAGSADTALAEKGYHNTILSAREINLQHKGKSRPPKATIKKLIGRLEILSCLDFKITVSQFIDISTPGKLKNWSAQLKVPLEFDEAIVDNPFISDKCSVFGSAAYASGKVGLITQSARHSGNCIVLFPDRADTDRSVEVTYQQHALFSCLPAKYAGRYDVDKDGRLAENRILVEIRDESHKLGLQEHIVPIHWN